MRIVLAASAAALAAAWLGAPAAAQPAGAPWSSEGRLDDSDSQDAEGHRYDEHALRLEAGRRYRISAASDEFDTYIRLFRAGDSEPVAENDDFEGLNSRIAYTPEETGTYMLRVSAFSPDGRGAYDARAEEVPPLPPPVTTGTSVPASGAWTLWQAELAATDPDRDGRHFDDYLVRMRAGETRLILAESETVDTLVWVLPAADREGEPIDLDDDAGAGLNALLGFRAEEDGDYIVRVTTFSPGETGAYRLWVSQ